ncbi:hypothetical protein [Alicyclobacillus sp. SO9]|uniref:hypothetical protein n=1 Tax=Alicyclobacillus sp. SO9 TaxID=2665646 RepID=UPI0018E80374|nr:hypothetical protein [Alicyclobacillus sp. SO9]QQE78623.1 hypothetical protein GI364_22645 [Alicyclobacillus sp. SO9]
MLWGKILICVIVATIITIGIQLRPGAQRPLSLWKQSAIFVMGLIVGVVMLSTRSLYLAGH